MHNVDIPGLGDRAHMCELYHQWQHTHGLSNNAHVYSTILDMCNIRLFPCGTHLAKDMDFGANTELLNDPGTATMLNRHSSLFDNPSSRSIILVCVRLAPFKLKN